MQNEKPVVFVQGDFEKYRKNDYAQYLLLKAFDLITITQSLHTEFASPAKKPTESKQSLPTLLIIMAISQMK